MNLDLIQPEGRTEDLVLSITKNCKTLIEKIHRKEEGKLEYKSTKPRETLSFKRPTSIERS